MYIFILKICHQDKFLEVGVLGQRVKTYIVSVDTDNFCSIDIVKFNIPTNNV